ncbi:hypothetical protein CCAX7_51370 [Capsulimonas corticalis]|uniref:Uncharacterized protein n=1 Tax=Capsulimonas corticalis TaxID=2219043 RepID=A0A402CP17_9BACT|nr:cytochrome-c peroxidase [Capsulimonas corticalis]BDI33086.1 hypothetical protein CCAX7_51370 [Capsulimonas corticalis]
MKKSTGAILLLTTLAICALLVSCFFSDSGRKENRADAAPLMLPAAHILEESIQPIPLTVNLDPNKVALGQQLFHDGRLSHDNTIACANCHSLAKGGTDQMVHSTGIGGAQGGINSPSVLNSGGNFVQFWNGRAATLEDQVNGPTHNPKEMGSNWPEIIGKLSKDDKYPALFAKLYPDGVQPQNVRDAIATFERSLTTPNSRFDKYLRGDDAVLTTQEKHGYRLFKEFGCVSCHQGQNLGGNMYQQFGVMANYFKERGTPETDDDQGRFTVTKREQDRHVFRVPSLRNVELTAPYFHDGTATTLPQAVEIMAKYQLGRPLAPEDLVDIVKFLQTLSGDQKGN